MENRALFGKWESYKSENLDTLFERLDMGWLKKTIGPKLISTLVIEKGAAPDKIKLTVTSIGFRDETVFKTNGVVPWSGGGNEVRDALTVWEDGKLVIYAGPLNSASHEDIKKNAVLKIIRQITDRGELLVTIIHPRVTATRHYRKKN